MNAQTTIRSFEERDTDAVVALWHEAGITRPWNDPYADVRRKQGVQPELFLVAEEMGNADEGDAGTRIVGAVMGGYDGHRGWINYLAVADSQRGTGLGRQLVERVEGALLALGCPKVQLQIRPDNTAVVDFYRHLGYDAYEVVDMGKRLIPDA